MKIASSEIKWTDKLTGRDVSLYNQENIPTKTKQNKTKNFWNTFITAIAIKGTRVLKMHQADKPWLSSKFKFEEIEVVLNILEKRITL